MAALTRTSLTAVVTTLAVLLSGCHSAPAPEVEERNMAQLESEVDETEYSRLDEAGIQQIVDSGIAKFDLRSGTETLAAVGLEGRDFGPVIGGPAKPEMLLVLDGPKGREMTPTRTIMIGVSPRAGTLYEIVFWHSTDTIDDAIEEVRQGLERWGYSRQRVDGWIGAVNEDRGSDYTRVVSSGVSPTGLITSIEVSYEVDKPVVLRYVVHVLPSFYDPENVEAIRRTGRSDPNLVAIP